MFKKVGILFSIAGLLSWLIFETTKTNSSCSYLETTYMTAQLKENQNCEYDRTEINIKEIFAKPFTYLSHGESSCAFQSEDQQYILKFFKMRDTRTEEEVAERLEGYDLAFHSHKKHTGIVLWHFYKTEDLKTQVNILDKIGVNRNTKVGMWRTIDLDDYIFVLQRKVEKLDKLLLQNLLKGDILQTRQLLKNIFNLYNEEFSKGLMDIDAANFLVNIGFCESTPIRFDVSHLRKFPDGLPRKVVEKFKSTALKTVVKWIQKRDLESNIELMEDIVMWLSNFPKFSASERTHHF